MPETKNNQPLKIFRLHGGTLRTSQALRLGIHPRTLYRLRDEGQILELSRGVYQLAKMAQSNHSELAAVAARVPDGVICLISALVYHELTKIAHEVYLALPRGKETPRIDYPPVRAFHFSGHTISAGVEIHKISGVEVKIFTAEKTVADCFKFRNRIGLDVALEALKMCLNSKGSRAKILKYARLCRVEKVISPYLEAID
jgi:predicted transcriptional regulator of viral defense system